MAQKHFRACESKAHQSLSHPSFVFVFEKSQLVSLDLLLKIDFIPREGKRVCVWGGGGGKTPLKLRRRESGGILLGKKSPFCLFYFGFGANLSNNLSKPDRMASKDPPTKVNWLQPRIFLSSAESNLPFEHKLANIILIR